MATQITRYTRATEKLDKKYRYLLTDIFDEKTLLFLESWHDNQTTRWRHLCNLVPDDISTVGSGKARIAYLTRHARVPLYLRTVGGEPPSPFANPPILAQGAPLLLRKRVVPFAGDHMVGLEITVVCEAIHGSAGQQKIHLVT